VAKRPRGPSDADSRKSRSERSVTPEPERKRIDRSRLRGQ
jgi:hypothetical protein